MQEQVEYTSLQRYLRTRGCELVASPAAVTAGRIQAIIGGGLLGCAAVAFLVAALQGHSVPALYGTLGPGIAGVVNLAVGLAIMRTGRTSRIDVTITPEARALLQELCRLTCGWTSTTFGTHGHHPSQGHLHQHNAGFHLSNAALQSVTRWVAFNPLIMEGIEAAAHQYNRLAGHFASQTIQVPSLGRHRERILRVADEAMVRLFHLAVIRAQFPEGAAHAKAEMENSVLQLKELADRVESIATSGTVETSSTTASEIAGILDDLRLEQAAQDEIRGIRPDENLEGRA